jgi:hypothetical protein
MKSIKNEEKNATRADKSTVHLLTTCGTRKYSSISPPLPIRNFAVSVPLGQSILDCALAFCTCHR